MIEIRLHSIGHVSANALVKLLLHFAFVIPECKLTPVQGFLTRRTKRAVPFTFPDAVDVQVRDAAGRPMSV